jgi:G3E family GTPase
MADPGPVAQTFFMDEEMKAKLRLDAILTLVDAKHVLHHMESDECRAQIASADILLLNKADLVSREELEALNRRVAEMNRLARIHETEHGVIDLHELLDVRAFDLEARAAEMPEFLQEELPFEWAGRFDLEPGDYRLILAAGPDPTIDLVFGGPGLEEADAFRDWKRAGILLYSSDPVFLESGASAEPREILYRLPVHEIKGAELTLRVSKPGRYVLFTQHLPEEFDLKFLDSSEQLLRAVEEQRYASPHEHDESVSSVGVQVAGDLDPDRFEQWITQLLRTRGPDLFRTKGVLALKNNPNRFVFQGVHMLFDGSDGKAWSDQDARESQLVFIGRDLDRNLLNAGLRACLA